jgi:hypothetical protein
MIAVAVVVAHACGGTSSNSASKSSAQTSPDQGGPIIPLLDPAFAGQWTSQAASLAPGSHFVTTVDGENFTMTGLCADGKGTMHAQASGRSISWVGEVICPAPSGYCAAGSVHYTSALLTLVDDNTMDAGAKAYVSGCGPDVGLAITMRLIRQ